MFKKNITRRNLAEKVHQKIGISKNISENIVNDVFELLTKEFEENNRVKISSFGTFKTSYKKQRTGRNPKTSIPSIISARKVVTFKSSKFLKDSVDKFDG